METAAIPQLDGNYDSESMEVDDSELNQIMDIINLKYISIDADKSEATQIVTDIINDMASDAVDDKIHKELTKAFYRMDYAKNNDHVTYIEKIKAQRQRTNL